MPALTITAFAITAPGDLDGPRPILYFADRALAERVLREMNSGSFGEYALREITVWTGTPQQTSIFEKKGWLNGVTGELLAKHPKPVIEEHCLWPWQIENWTIGAHAGPVPVGIYIGVTDWNRAKVETEFERLVAQERTRIAANS